MELIDREAILDYMKGWKGETVEFVRSLPAVDAVPIKSISSWLAGYAAPPNYALDAITEDIDPASIVYTVNDRARAWEYHLNQLIECGLMEEGHDPE